MAKVFSRLQRQCDDFQGAEVESKNWIGWFIGILRVWGSKGASLGLVAFFFGYAMTFGEGIPPYLPPALLLGGAAFMAFAAIRTYRILQIGGRGERVEAVVKRIEKRKRSTASSQSGPTTQLRIFYDYSFDGSEQNGFTTWTARTRHLKRFGELQRGDKITVVVDPSSPSSSVALLEVPGLE